MPKPFLYRFSSCSTAPSILLLPMVLHLSFSSSSWLLLLLSLSHCDLTPRAATCPSCSCDVVHHSPPYHGVAPLILLPLNDSIVQKCLRLVPWVPIGLWEIENSNDSSFGAGLAWLWASLRDRNWCFRHGNEGRHAPTGSSFSVF